MTTPMRLSLAITADASGVSPATAEARREIQSLGDQARETSRAQVAANDQAAAAAKRATDAVRGQSAAEKDLRGAVMQFAGGRTPLNDNEYRRRAVDVEAYGDALDRLRARYNPLFAVTRGYLQSRAEIRQAHQVGAISANEMTEALSRERQATLASIAAIKNRNAAIADTPVRGGMGAASFNTANIAAQFQDIGVTSAMGMSPIQIALQQGTQLSAVLNTMGGTRGAIAGLGAAFMQIVNPVSLVTIGVVGLTAAALQYFSTFLSGSEESEELLNKQADLIQAVADKWGGALPSIKAYADEQERLAGQRDVADATAIASDKAWEDARAAIKDARIEVASVVDALRNVDHDGVVELQDAFNTLRANVAAGKTDTEDLERVSRALSDLYKRTQIQSVDELAQSFANLAGEIEKANTATTLQRAEQNLLNLQSQLPSLGTIPPVFSGDGQFIDADGVQTARANAAKSKFQLEQERLARRGNAVDSEANAYRDLIKSADDRIAQMQTEIELLGRVGAEAEALRYEQELLNRATDKGRELDEKQIAAIRAKAEEYGRLKTELAATRLEQDLMFEREQLFRSPTEQRVASTLRGANIDPASERGQAIAEQIRYNEQLAFGRDLARDFGDSLVNAFADGKLEGKELLGIVTQLIQQLMNMPGGLGGIGGVISGIFGGGFNPSPTGFMDMLMDSGGTILGGNVIPFGPKTRQLRNGIVADSGFGPRHFKAVLEEGETVLTRDMTNRAMNVMSGAASTGAGDGVLRLVLEPSKLFDVRMEEVSGEVAQRVSIESVRQYDKTATSRFNRDARMTKRLGAR